ncbi:MAG: dTDP-4-dehydrorhamnose 3,5-epimerase [bacterium]|jgi:dTDP-4-dehydrorhamnose 3,5-epimerase
MLENRTAPGSSSSVPDRQTVTPDGQPVDRLVHGMDIREITTHTDDRGTVFELFDQRWGWHDEPVVFSYVFTIRPGAIKGWGLHRRHEDRYALLFGEMELVLYDAREDSPTHGLVSKIVLSEHRRQLVNIPAGVWHADRTLGSRDAVIVNFPTIPYDHAAPDKERLPLDTPLIPYSFEDPAGW